MTNKYNFTTTSSCGSTVCLSATSFGTNYVGLPLRIHKEKSNEKFSNDVEITVRRIDGSKTVSLGCKSAAGKTQVDFTASAIYLGLSGAKPGDYGIMAEVKSPCGTTAVYKTGSIDVSVCF